MHLYILQHIYELNVGEKEAKIIGIYTSIEKAEKAKLRMINLEGFSDYPENFELLKIEVDKSYHTNGF